MGKLFNSDVSLYQLKVVNFYNKIYNVMNFCFIFFTFCSSLRKSCEENIAHSSCFHRLGAHSTEIMFN